MIFPFFSNSPLGPLSNIREGMTTPADSPSIAGQRGAGGELFTIMIPRSLLRGSSFIFVSLADR